MKGIIQLDIPQYFRLDFLEPKLCLDSDVGQGTSPGQLVPLLESAKGMYFPLVLMYRSLGFGWEARRFRFAEAAQ